MITLITGLPGNGKTLYALAWLRERAVAESRQVYYSGIADCMIPGWIELTDPTVWATLPKGSIVLVDEAQRIFRPRMHGSSVPPFVAALETHRHLGIDLVFITQHPMLVDANVRRLVGQHFHVIRKFGSHFATIHEWNKVKETCDKSREDSVRHEWRFPADVFGLYKSAELHTHKRRIPFKVWALLAMPFLLGSLAWWAWSRLDPTRKVEGGQAGQVVAGSQAGQAGQRGPMTAEQYLVAHQPRIAGLAHTAPVYDPLTLAPQDVPYPAACVSMGEVCQCYTGQATRLDIAPKLCADIVARGFFIAWKAQSAQGPSGGAPGTVGAPAPWRAPSASPGALPVMRGASGPSS